MKAQPGTAAVLLPDGRIEPFWIVDDWAIDDAGALNLLDDGETHASFAAGEWHGVGFLTLAHDVRLADRSGQMVPPDEWEGFDEE
jgi:hypothetical protein